MRITIFLLFLLAIFSLDAVAQRRQPVKTGSKTVAAETSRDVNYSGVVMDESISLLRRSPSLYAEVIQRMRRGRKVKIIGVTEADGVRFFKVSATPPAEGWVQAEAVFSEKRHEDEERLALLVQATRGFEQVETAVHFLKMYPASKFRPPILLLFGDILEDAAARLTRDANNRLNRSEMAATGAPLHSYYLNFVGLDRYRKLGVTFVFNSGNRAFHYNGAAWKEIVDKFPNSVESEEARGRLDSFRDKMAKTAAN